MDCRLRNVRMVGCCKHNLTLREYEDGPRPHQLFLPAASSASLSCARAADASMSTVSVLPSRAA